MKHRFHLLHREGDVVDGPLVEAVKRSVVLGEGHDDRLVGRGSDRVRLAEMGVIPMERGRLRPCRLAGSPCIFNDDTHASRAVVIGEITHHPHAWMIHLDDGRDPLSSAKPQHRNLRRCGDRIAIEGDDLEAMFRKRQTADLGGAAVDDVEQHPLAWFDADGLAVAEQAAVDREEAVADLEAMRHAHGQRGAHRGLDRKSVV